MTTTKFNTNIRCTGCIEKVTPYLNETVGEGNWSVDLANPSRTLTVEGDVTPETVSDALKKAGYNAVEAQASGEVAHKH